MREDTRYRQQWLRRNASVVVMDASAPGGGKCVARTRGRAPVIGHRGRTRAFHRDWSTSLGSRCFHAPERVPGEVLLRHRQLHLVMTMSPSRPTSPARQTLSIVAFNNLYAGSSPCGGLHGPTALFAYQTQTNGGVTVDFSRSIVLRLRRADCVHRGWRRSWGAACAAMEFGGRRNGQRAGSGS